MTREELFKDIREAYEFRDEGRLKELETVVNSPRWMPVWADLMAYTLAVRLGLKGGSLIAYRGSSTEARLKFKRGEAYIDRSVLGFRSFPYDPIYEEILGNFEKLDPVYFAPVIDKSLKNIP